MTVFILNDAYNLFHRQINVTNPAYGVDSVIGMALHMILYSMKKEYTKWNGTHCVFFLEGRSWRRDIYPEYKAQRRLQYSIMTEKEQEEQKLLQDAFSDLVNFISEKTNITVLRNPTAEADDMIKVWIEVHPDDSHVLISSDSDFFQLLKYPNVILYDPVKNILIKREGVFNDKNERLSFTISNEAKIKVGKPDPNFIINPDWYEYALFLKCIRGDKTDNIFSAYPGVREKGTKKTIGIMEAYSDRIGKGYDWNNFMHQRWVDHNQVEQKVKDRYEFNKKLIDLSEMPEDVKVKCIEIISEETEKKDIPALEIGMGFMKFTGKWDLKRISDNSSDFLPMLKSKYKG